MPRIRTIKPEFWSSPGVDGMDPWARLLYIAMWNWADDYGRGTANPKELAAFAFPYDAHIGAKEIPSMLKEVATRFDVIFYRVSGRRYYVIPSWDRHQRTERRAQPQHPGPGDAEMYDVDPDDQQECVPAQEVPTSSAAKQGNSDVTQGSSGPGTGEQGNRGTGEGKTRSSEMSKSKDDRFDEFWSAYPKRVGKQAAIKAWRKAVKLADPETIVDGARRYAEARSGGDQQYTAHPSTWLNAGRWDDEPQPKQTSQSKPSTGDQRIAQLQARKRGPPAANGDASHLQQQVRALPEWGSA